MTTYHQRNLTTETNKCLKDIAKQYGCNIALTIQPNNSVNSINGLQQKMGLVGDEINKRFFLRKPYKGKLFYVATIEHNYSDGYHLHLAMHIPKERKDWFMRKIDCIVKHPNQFPKASIKVEEIYDLDGWMNYITKDMYKVASQEHYFFNNTYNQHKRNINNKKIIY